MNTKSLQVQVDESTYRALAEIAPPSSRKRAQFIRDAIRKAIREAQYARIRRAHQQRSDAESEADDWSEPEEYSV